MLDTLQRYFNEAFGLDELAGAPVQTLELAIAVLLIEIAQTDHRLEQSERDEIIQTLQEDLSLTDAEAACLVDQAHEEHGRSVSFRPLVRIINNNLEPAEKYMLIRALWRVALADQHLHKYEEHQIRKIADWLHVPHRDLIRAKLEVLA